MDPQNILTSYFISYLHMHMRYLTIKRRYNQDKPKLKTIRAINFN